LTLIFGIKIYPLTIFQMHSQMNNSRKPFMNGKSKHFPHWATDISTTLIELNIVFISFQRNFSLMYLQTYLIDFIELLSSKLLWASKFSKRTQLLGTIHLLSIMFSLIIFSIIINFSIITNIRHGILNFFVPVPWRASKGRR